MEVSLCSHLSIHISHMSLLFSYKSTVSLLKLGFSLLLFWRRSSIIAVSLQSVDLSISLWTFSLNFLSLKLDFFSLHLLKLWSCCRNLKASKVKSGLFRSSPMYVLYARLLSRASKCVSLIACHFQTKQYTACYKSVVLCVHLKENNRDLSCSTSQHRHHSYFASPCLRLCMQERSPLLLGKHHGACWRSYCPLLLTTKVILAITGQVSYDLNPASVFSDLI